MLDTWIKSSVRQTEKVSNKNNKTIK